MNGRGAEAKAVGMLMERINHDYFEWLLSQIRIRSTRQYSGLLWRLYETEFVWTVPHDDNRVRDALDLRVEFLYTLPDKYQRKAAGFDDGRVKGASVLEVIVALSRRLAFIAEGHPEDWAWKLIKNLGLSRMSDPLTQSKMDKIDDVLNALIWRTYKRNGEGGFFPLQNSVEDQTQIEIWYQMNAYVIEMNAH